MKGCHWNGKLCALPLDLWPHVIFYNKTLFKEAGVEAPPTDWNDKSWTYDVLREKAKALTKTEGDTTTQFGVSFVFDNWPTGWLFGGDWFPKETYEKGVIEQFTGDTDEKTLAAVQWFADLMLKDNRSGEVIWEEKGFTGRTEYFRTGMYAQTERAAAQSAREDLAKKVVDRIIEDW